MAELNVVRKKKSPLPWILLALVILGLVAYLLLRSGNDGTTPATAEDASPAYDTTGQNTR